MPDWHMQRFCFSRCMFDICKVACDVQALGSSSAWQHSCPSPSTSSMIRLPEWR